MSIAKSKTVKDERVNADIPDKTLELWLREHNRKLTSDLTCHNCRKTRVETLFLPCRHVVACEDCSSSMENCIVCGAQILGTAKTYLV